MRPSLALAPQTMPPQAPQTMPPQASQTMPPQAPQTIRRQVPLQTMLLVRLPKKTRAPCTQRKLPRRSPRLSLSNLTLPPRTTP
jgi:hypothetical protein